MPGPHGLGPRGFLTEEEKQDLPKVDGALIGRILSYLKPYWLQFILVFVTILLSAVIGLFPSIITGKIVDEALVGQNMALLVKLLIRNDVPVKNAKVAILGFTFKENCPDTRNSKVIDIYNELGEYGITPMVVDPEADAEEAYRLYGIRFASLDDVKDMDAVLIAVKHKEFADFTPEKIAAFYNPKHTTKVFVDLKGMFERASFPAPAWDYWRL